MTKESSNLLIRRTAKKHKTSQQCRKLVPRFLRAVVGDTLHTWSEEIARMWRFTRSNGIT